MNVICKLKEAEHFLEKLYEVQGVEDRFKRYLDRFLAAVRSIPYFLLRDYSVRFGLHVPLVEKLYSELFEEIAEQIENKEAINFIQWWKQKMEELEKDPLGSLLIDERRINTQNIFMLPELYKVEAQTRAPLVQKVEEYGVRVGWFFKEYDMEPVLIVCEKFLNIMKRFVDEAETKFPPI